MTLEIWQHDYIIFSQKLVCLIVKSVVFINIFLHYMPMLTIQKKWKKHMLPYFSSCFYPPVIWLRFSCENCHFDPLLQNCGLLSKYTSMTFNILTFITIHVYLLLEK